MRKRPRGEARKAKSAERGGAGGGLPPEVDRRSFLEAAAAALLAASAPARPHRHPVPQEKSLPNDWLAGARRAGAREPYRGDQLKNLAFPLGGIGTGFVALAGNGELVEWQIFNNIDKKALVQSSMAISITAGDRKGEKRMLGRAARVSEERRAEAEGALQGFAEAQVVGEYPIATLALKDPNFPLEATIEAWNPLVPLDAKASSYPAAIVTVTARNRGATTIRADLKLTVVDPLGDPWHRNFPQGRPPGNRTLRHSHSEKAPQSVAQFGVDAAAPARLTKKVRVLFLGGRTPALTPEQKPAELVITPRSGLAGVNLADFDAVVVGFDADPPETDDLRRLAPWIARGGILVLAAIHASAPAGRARIAWLDEVRSQPPNAVPTRKKLFAGFEANYDGWTTEGTAFGSAPSTGPVGWQNPISGWNGGGFVNSFQPDDRPVGTLTSPEFEIDRNYIHLLVGGGADLSTERVELLVDGRVELAASGRNTETLAPVLWDVIRYRGKKAKIRALDRGTGGWGHVLLDHVTFSDSPNPNDRTWTPEAMDEARRLFPDFESSREDPVPDCKPARLAMQKAPGSLQESDLDLGFLVWSAVVAVDPGATPPRGVPSGDPRFGTVAMAVAGPETSGTMQLLQALPLQYGLLNIPGEEGALAAVRAHFGQNPMIAVLTAKLDVPPEKAATATFLLAWHFPNRHISGKNVGNQYAKWWKDAADVVRDLTEKLPALEEATRAYARALHDSTLPWPIVDAAGSQACIARSPTLMWLGDGNVAGYEGLSEREGCCPMNCCHVYNYVQTVARLFPELERNVRRLDLERQQNADGGVNNRIVVPIPPTPSGEHPFADGHLSTILKTYREHLNSPDDAFLRSLWPNTKKALDWAIRELDRDDDGVFEAAQWNTYDQIVTGVNTFIGTQYLASLRAGEEMAKRMGEPELGARYRKLFESGAARYAKIGWNGEWFEQRGGTEVGAGCLADQLLGEWWARILGLGTLLPREQVRTALRSIYKYNFLADFTNFRHQQRVFANGKDRGLLNCTWPKGGRPGSAGYPGKPILYCDEVWTGVEYAVASLMLYEGLVDEALTIVRAARDRYDGTKRNPWNEIECGDQYARAMSSWSLLLASQGFFLDGPAGALRFDPIFSPEAHRSLWTGPEGWGIVRVESKDGVRSTTLEVLAGKLVLREVRLRAPEGHAVASVEPDSARGAGRIENGEAIITFPEPFVATPERPVRFRTQSKSR